MANCPKCGKHLHFYNVSQICPECGTNMTFYGFVDNFIKEAKMAELSQAKTHVMIKHIKAAYIGSKLAIARLIVMILPAVGFLIPAAKFEFNIPFLSYSGSGFDVSGLGIYNFFNAGGIEYTMSMMKSTFAGAEFKALMTALAAYALGAVFAVLVLLLSILCLFSYKNMQKITAVVAGLGIVDAFAAMVLVGKFVKTAANGTLMTASNGFGLWVIALLFAVVFVVNLLLWIKGIPAEYGEGMLERAEIYKKVKKGEINIDDLPQPVVETEETRKIEEEIRKEEAAHEEKRKKKEKEAAQNG